MYKSLNSIIGTNSSSPIISNLHLLWKNYKYFIISALSIFILLDLTLNGDSSLMSSSLSSINYDAGKFNNGANGLTDASIANTNNNNNNNNLNQNANAQALGSSSYLSTNSRPPRKNVKDMYTIEARLNYYFPYNNKNDIENNIFQLWKTKLEDNSFPFECKSHVERWRNINDNYNHNLITLKEAEETIVDHFKPNVPEVVEALRLLPNERLKFEFLKYLIIYIYGGLYADIDTVCIKPLKYWYDSRIIPGKFITGITTDYNDVNWEKLYNRRLQFSNNLFKSKSHHPFLAKLIARITFITFNQKDIIKNINWDEVFANVDANGEPLIQFTGASIFTDTLFEYLNSLQNAIFIRVAKNERDKDLKPIVGPEVPASQRFSYQQLSGSIAPSQIDDVIIMPSITFQGSILADQQKDSHSIEDEYDNEDKKQGYEKLYYARPLAFAVWNKKDT